MFPSSEMQRQGVRGAVLGWHDNVAEPTCGKKRFDIYGK